MTTGVITELSDSDKDPGFFGETAFGAGAITLSDIPLKLLLVGLKHSSLGSLTTNTEVVRVYSETDVDTYAGAGGDLARMGYAALKVSGVEVWLAAVADGTSPAAATMTITIAGTWSTTGSYKYWIAGMEISGGVLSTDTPTTLAAAIVAAITAKTKCAATAANVAGVITVTWKSLTIRGNNGIVFQDTSELPSGTTSTLGGGGTSTTGDATTGAGITFTGGVGTEDVTTLLATIYPSRFHRIAIAQRDSTNLGLWETQLDSKAGPYENRMEHLVCGSPGTYSAAAALALSPLNQWRAQMLHFEASETPMEEIVAQFAAIRTVTEQTTPNVSYDGRVLDGVRPQRDRSKWPNRARRVAALNAGVTPLATSEQGEVSIIRSITTRSQTSSGDPDYRTLDTSEAVVPDYVRDDLKLYWQTVFLVANPYVDDDPPNEAKESPAGIATPKRWNAAVQARLLEHEANFLLTGVNENPPRTTYNSTARRLASVVPTKVLPLQHQMEVSVRQIG
jgi:phage tail sheath gpL-like